jgi:hypothetical protein
MIKITHSLSDNTSDKIFNITLSENKVITGSGKTAKLKLTEKEFENDEDIKHAVSHPRTVDFAKVLKQKLDKKDYDLISKITRNNFR